MEDKSLKKILIIDDNQELVLGLSILLNSQGYLTLAAYDGLYGISLANKENVDLIILDLSLPEAGGIFVLEKLKNSVNTSNIPVLVITARPEKELQEKAYQTGALVVFRKPFDNEQFLKRIKETIG